MKKQTEIKVIKMNEPNIRLMAEAAINLFYDNEKSPLLKRASKGEKMPTQRIK